MDPKGKVALITGGARIGATVAADLAARGAGVAISYRRSQAAAQETVEAIRSAGGTAAAIEADLTQPEAAGAVVAETEKLLGRLDVLVHMVSLYERTPWDELDAASWDRHIGADARSAYLVAVAASRPMKRQGEGRIVLFSDWLAPSGRPRYKDYLLYYTAKSAVVGLAQGLALELAPRILVNAIAPGPILAPPDLSDEEDREVRRATPLGRWGGAGEIAKAVAFLVESDFVTGECIRVDGGRHLQ